MIRKYLGRFFAMGLAAVLVAGCSTGDNSSTMMTDSEGKATKVENEDAPKKYASSEDAYKGASGQNYMKAKGYKKR